MKTLLITDMHGKNPLKLVNRMIKKGIEQVVFLGDYDTPEIMKEIRGINLRKKFIVGNHDLHYVYEMEIEGKMMENTARGYANLWDKNPIEKNFILDAISGKTPDAKLILEEEIEDGSKIAYCHGGIINTNSSDLEILEGIWQRMNSMENIKINFDKMINQKYDILFRGHDHNPSTIVLTGSKNIMEKTIENKISLIKYNKYIASVGSFYWGDYAIFDSTTREIEYRNIGED